MRTLLSGALIGLVGLCGTACAVEDDGPVDIEDQAQDEAFERLDELMTELETDDDPTWSVDELASDLDDDPQATSQVMLAKIIDGGIACGWCQNNVCAICCNSEECGYTCIPTGGGTAICKY